MNGRFEWLVAWRYLRDPDRRASAWLFIGLAILVVGAGLAWLANGLPRPDVAATKVSPALKYGRYVFAGGGILALLGAWIALFGACLTAFRLFTSISIIGVSFPTQALIFVLSVMSGFEDNLRRSILGNNAHVVITRGPKPFKLDPAVERRLVDRVGKPRIQGLVAITPFLKDEVILSGPKAHSGVYLKGIDPKNPISRKLVGDNIRIGTIDNLIYPERLRYLAPATVPITVTGGDANGDGLEPARLEPRLRPQPRPTPSGMSAPERLRPALPAMPPPTAIPRPQDNPAPQGMHATGPAVPAPARPTPEPPAPKATAQPPPGTTVRRPAHAAKVAPSPALPLSTDRDPGLGPVVKTPDEPAVHPGIPQPMYPKVLPGIILGRELAKTLGLRLGDQVDVISTKTQDIIVTGPMPRLKEFRVAGIFFSGHYEYDQKYAYVALPEAQAFLRKQGMLSGLEIRTSSPRQARAVAARIRQALGTKSSYEVRPWQQIHKAIFSALEAEKIAMFLVLVIIVLVASFSIAANLIMMVTEKSAEIAVLRSMGAKQLSILRIFLYEGLYIGLLGMATGIGWGIVLSLSLRHYGFALDPEIYYIRAIPVAIDPWEVAMVAASVILISLAAALFPAIRAMRKRPVESLRYK